MTTLTIELPTVVYQRLQAEAARLGKATEEVAQTWLAEQSRAAEPSVLGARQQLRDAMGAAGKLAALSPQEKELAAQSTLSLSEARAILDRAGGQPLSEIILDMRGPKE